MDINVFNDKTKEEIRKINFGIEKQISSTLESLELTKTQANILICLKNESAALLVNTLSERLDMPASNISNTCTRLEFKGLIERVRGEEDRREVKIKLTPKGEEKGIAAEHYLMKAFMEMAEKTTPEERMLIVAGLETYSKILHS